MPTPSHIVVREYEYLTRYNRHRPNCHDLTNKQFDTLKDFVLQNLGDDETPRELMHLCSPPGIGEAFQLRNYVGQQLRLSAIRSRALRKVELQVHTEWLFDDKQVSLRPDIVCERHDGRLVVLDTKWKRVSRGRDLSAADMHQMYAYGRRYRADGEEVQRVVLLYPWHKGVESGLQVKEGFTSPDGVQVDLFFVDLARMGESVRELVRVVAEV